MEDEQKGSAAAESLYPATALKSTSISYINKMSDKVVHFA